MSGFHSALLARLRSTGYPVSLAETVPDGVRLPWLSCQVAHSGGAVEVTATVWVDGGLPALFEAVERMLTAVPRAGVLLTWAAGCCWLRPGAWRYQRDPERRDWVAVRFVLSGRLCESEE